MRNSEEVVAEMIAAGVKPLDPYPGSSLPWRCECLRCGKVTMTRYTGIQRGESGCLVCGNRSSAATRTKSSDEAEALMRAAGYEPLEPYRKSNLPWKCRHEECGAIVTPSYATIQQGNGGCKSCADFGIDYNGPAILYLMRNDDYQALKIGITGVTSVKDRVEEHRRRGWIDVRTWDLSSGFAAEEVEGRVIDYWRNVLGAPASVPRDAMPQGGWTETAALLLVDVEETCGLVDSYLGVEQGLADSAGERHSPPSTSAGAGCPGHEA